MTKSCVHVVISGLVQGVWFRTSTKNKAEQLGITGWVKNAHNGCVESVFEGDENTVQEMIDWCHIGPPHAEVKKVEVTNQSPCDGFEDFSIKY